MIATVVQAPLPTLQLRAAGFARRACRVHPGTLRLLLASSSVAALLIGGGTPPALAAPCAITENGASVATVTNSAAINCIDIESSTVTGNVTNTGTGTITTNGNTPPTATGITINNSTIGGTVSNVGTIHASFAGVIVNNATVAGGITNSGTISVASFLGSGIGVSGPTFAAGISNSGTITAGFGLVAGNFTSFGNGITNGGTIAAVFAGIQVNGGTTGPGATVGTFAGGISNSGTITAAVDGITVVNTSRFDNGITNSGSIGAGSDGILVGGYSQTSVRFLAGVGTFAGGISNTGTITSTNGNGIEVGGSFHGNAGLVLSTFGGDITNIGTIRSTNGNGILVGGNPTGFQHSTTVSTFSGAIVNIGTITAGFNGIAVGGSPGNDSSTTIVTFANGITNTGMISAGRWGILVGDAGAGSVTIANFAGGISNAGTITAGEGIVVGGSRFATISTFLGGITNSGRISASTGINVSNAGSFGGDIVNAAGGTISGGFVGIRFANTQAGVYQVSNFSGNIRNAGTISASHSVISVNGVSTFSGSIVNSGTILGATSNAIRVLHVSTFTGAIVNSGTISGSGGGIRLSSIAVFGTASAGGGIVNSGAILLSGSSKNGIEVNVATFMGGITNSGTISAGASAIGIAVAATTFIGNVSNSGTITGARTGISICSCATMAGGAIVNSGNITAGLTAIDASAATSAVTINQVAGTITGNILLSAHADVLNITGGTIAGNVVGQGSSDTINFAPVSGTFTYGSGFGFSLVNQVNVNSGLVILNGTNSATNLAVNGGTLEIGDASNAGATLTIANQAQIFGTLAGHGTLAGATVIENGGTLAPGGSIGTLTINGTLTFAPGSRYVVTIAGATNSKTLVTGAPGTATINGGTVMVTLPSFTLGAHAGATYTILTATGGRTGTFAGLTVNGTGNFTGRASLSYDADDVFFNIGSGFVLLSPPSGANINQQNVLNGINDAILTGAILPAGFQSLGSLSGPVLLGALTQLDGEVSTGAEKGAFQLMNDFLGLMLDPSVDGRGGAAGGSAGSFAAEPRMSFAPDGTLSYAGVLKAPPAPTFEQRWSAWASAFGGYNKTSGNAVIGSNDVIARDYGSAGGFDYRVSPDTVMGVAFGGGGTSWSLAQGLGSGRSDAFLAGAYGTTRLGPAYLSAALAYANHWMSTSRTAFAGDQLAASFNGQSYGARLEAGYRYGLPITGAAFGVTPYAAVQTQRFHTPGYSESDLTGGGFGLAFNAASATDTRSELGARFDNLTWLNGMPLMLRARVAWAHDWISNPALGAVFQTLPDSAFTVNGAAPPKSSALTSAAAELRLTANWSASVKFDGEFGSGSQTYAGTGTLRYSW